MADHAVALWLAAARRIREYDEATRRGEWRWQTGKPIWRLRGRVLGLLSFGAIARGIADRARPFGVEIWAHDPFVDAAELARRGVRAVSFDELVEGSDYLMVQAPLTSSTRGMFHRDTLRRMKPTSILVNTARGPIVEDAALAEALAAKQAEATALEAELGTTKDALASAEASVRDAKQQYEQLGGDEGPSAGDKRAHRKAKTALAKAQTELAKLEAQHAELNNRIKRKRLELPWVKVESRYEFDTETGRRTRRIFSRDAPSSSPTTSCTGRITRSGHAPAARASRTGSTAG